MPRPLKHPRRQHIPVANTFDIEREREQARIKEPERQLDRQLGLKLINSGYKALAVKLHPDKGGSPDDMVRLSRVRDGLKKNA